MEGTTYVASMEHILGTCLLIPTAPSTVEGIESMHG